MKNTVLFTGVKTVYLSQLKHFYSKSYSNTLYSKYLASAEGSPSIRTLWNRCNWTDIYKMFPDSLSTDAAHTHF